MLCLIIISCQKYPQASFTTDKTQYVAGDTIKLTNTTLYGSTYKWTLPDGQTPTTKDFDFITNELYRSASYEIILEAFSSNGKKTDRITKRVSINAVKGDVLFWQHTNSFFLATEVSINGLTSYITSKYSSTPDCGASGCAVFKGLDVGTYFYTASNNFSYWSGNVTVTKGNCLKIELQ